MQTTASLYERLGGVYAIANVVDDFHRSWDAQSDT